MAVVISKVSDLKMDDHNANKGTAVGKKMLAESLKELGAGRSILIDRNGKIIAGNKTTAEASFLGLEDVIIVQTDGTQMVAVQRTDLDLDTDDKAKRLAIADNRISQADLDWDAEVLAQLQQDSPEVLEGLFTDDQVQEIINNSIQNGEDLENEDDEEKSDGSLLALLNVTIAEPRNKVERGEVWQLGSHYLVCEDVVAGWQLWAPLLKDGVLLATYAGPFIPLSRKADEHPILMVQPDKYIAGHILDHYEEIKGAGSFKKVPAL